MPENMTPESAHIDVPLSRMAIKAFEGVGDFIAAQLFPTVPVDKQSDGYYILDPENWLRTYDTKRAPKTEAKRGEWQTSTDTYFCPNYAFGTDHALETIANADSALRVRENSVNFVTEVLARDREIRLTEIVTTSGNLGHTEVRSGTNQWNDYDSSDPISDVLSAHAYIRNHTGMRANVCAMDRDTYEVLRFHPLIRDYTKYVERGPVPEDMLRTVFGVDRILVGHGIYNGTKEGQSMSLQNIWGHNFVLARVSPAISLQTATLALQFNWRPEGFPAPMAVQRFPHYNPSVKAEILEAHYFSDEKIIAKDLGYLIKNTIA